MDVWSAQLYSAANSFVNAQMGMFQMNLVMCHSTRMKKIPKIAENGCATKMQADRRARISAYCLTRQFMHACPVSHIHFFACVLA